MNNEILIGTEVEIINTGIYYPTNEKAARILGANKWRPNAELEKGDKGILINKIEFGIYTLCLVDLGIVEIVIEERGLMVISIPEWNNEENRL